jgi:transcriptional regulator with XRE-family HTH domain
MEYILFIKYYRTLQNMTQKELAFKSRLNQSYISQLEENSKNAKSPTLRVIFNISSALNVCPHLLVRYHFECEHNCFKSCKQNIF